MSARGHKKRKAKMSCNVESMVSRHPAVRAAVVFGRGQRNIGILVFPKETEDIEGDASAFKDRLWYMT